MKHFFPAALLCLACPGMLMAAPKGDGSDDKGADAAKSLPGKTMDPGSAGNGAQGGSGASGAGAGAGLGFDLNRPDTEAFTETGSALPSGNLPLDPAPGADSPLAMAKETADQVEGEAATADRKVSDAKMALDQAKLRPWESAAAKLAAYRQAVQEAREARQKAHQAWTRYEEARRASGAPPLSLAIEAADRAHATAPTLDTP